MEWRKELVDREVYVERKRNIEVFVKKEERLNKELLKETRKAKTEEQVWKMVNKEKKRKIKINREIRTVTS